MKNKLNVNVGVIGCGNMGSAIVSGLVKHKIVAPQKIFVSDLSIKKAKKLSKKFHVKILHDNATLMARSKVVIIAVKPQKLVALAKTIKARVKKSHLVISILAGVPKKSVKHLLGDKCQVVRAMPNLPAVVGEGVTALTGDRASISVAKKIFSGCGRTVVINEKFFDLVTAVSGSGPAYFYLLMEILEKRAVKIGLRKNEAALLVKQSAYGSALLARESALSAFELRKQVTSKGGTTEAALKVMKKAGFESIVSKALDSAVKRAKKLKKGVANVHSR